MQQRGSAGRRVATQSGVVSADIGYRFRQLDEDPSSAKNHASFIEIGCPSKTCPETRSAAACRPDLLTTFASAKRE